MLIYNVFYANWPNTGGGERTERSPDDDFAFIDPNPIDAIPIQLYSYSDGVIFMVCLQYLAIFANRSKR
jgi:hypothetical protein